MIQFACPSCQSTCSVDDRFAKRKLKCPKCGARVLHLGEKRVELLTPGAARPAAPAATPESQAPTEDMTPVATAVLPHSVGEFMSESESKQNLHIVAGLLGLFAALAIILGIALGLRLLVVTPIAVVLSAVGIGLWLHTRKLKQQLDQRRAQKEGAPR